MTESLTDVVSGSVTRAVRDTTIDGLDIHKDDILGMVNGKNSLYQIQIWIRSYINCLKKMIAEDSEIVTIYVGEEGSQEQAQKLS